MKKILFSIVIIIVLFMYIKTIYVKKAINVKSGTPVIEITDTLAPFTSNTPGPADIYNNTPYHLLSDEMPPPRAKESISCVNSRSCYATDFERAHDKTGNFAQVTNNYKRNYPDSCSAPYQELTLNYYKVNQVNTP